jgi:hypothetical protein
VSDSKTRLILSPSVIISPGRTAVGPTRRWPLIKDHITGALKEKAGMSARNFRIINYNIVARISPDEQLVFLKGDVAARGGAGLHY